jgi:hypothetical protein
VLAQVTTLAGPARRCGRPRRHSPSPLAGRYAAAGPLRRTACGEPPITRSISGYAHTHHGEPPALPKPSAGAAFGAHVWCEGFSRRGCQYPRRAKRDRRGWRKRHFSEAPHRSRSGRWRRAFPACRRVRLAWGRSHGPKPAITHDVDTPRGPGMALLRPLAGPRACRSRASQFPT